MFETRSALVPFVLCSLATLVGCSSQSSTDPSTAPTHAETSAGGEQTPSSSSAPSTANDNVGPAASASPLPVAVTDSSPDRPRALPGSSIRFDGGDGTSAEQAIVIAGAHGESDGTESEYRYLQLAFGRVQVRRQALLTHDGHHLDMLEFEQNGIVKQIFFDIEGYFGRM